MGERKYYESITWSHVSGTNSTYSTSCKVNLVIALDGRGKTNLVVISVLIVVKQKFYQYKILK